MYALDQFNLNFIHSAVGGNSGDKQLQKVNNSALTWDKPAQKLQIVVFFSWLHAMLFKTRFKLCVDLFLSHQSVLL